MAKLITVFGATGAQGGSVVDALLAAGDFKVRGVTRDVKSAQAEALSKKGVEVVQGNIADAESVKKVITGSYGVFLVTSPMDKDQFGKEYEIGKHVVDAAIEAKITHFVWSTLPNVQLETKGKFRVPFFTEKAKVEDYSRKAGFIYHTYVAAPGYYQNWGKTAIPKKLEDGSFVFNLPIHLDAQLSSGDIREIGLLVSTAFRNPKGWGNGDFIAATSEDITLKETCQVLSEHLGVKVSSNYISREEFKKKTVIFHQI